MEKFERSPAEKAPEKIEKAAVRYEGKLYLGVNHAEALDELNKAHPEWFESKGTMEDGFVTSRGRFVDREKAGRIALVAQQLEHLGPVTKSNAATSLDFEKLHPDFKED